MSTHQIDKLKNNELNSNLLTKLFASTSSRVKKLMKLKQGTDNETWTKTAIEIFVKTMIKDKGKDGAHKDLQYLELVLSNPNEPSKCIVFLTPADGRIKVSDS